MAQDNKKMVVPHLTRKQSHALFHGKMLWSKIDFYEAGESKKDKERQDKS